MPIARFLRVVCFQPGGADSSVDTVLRDAVVPRLLERDEIVDAWIGRHGSRADPTRVLVSTWRAEPGAEPGAMPADLAVLRDHGLPEGASIEGPIDHLALAVHARFDRSDPARILRVFRGRVRAGELDRYIAEAQTGMAADAAVNDGLIAFALGVAPPDGFVTVSVWTGWPAIETATGGNTRQPVATRNAGRLSGFTVAHYEIVPETPTSRDDGPGAPA